MQQPLSLVTLGTSDLERAIAFYEALGWERAASPPEVAFFQAGGIVFGLWARTSLVEDCGLPDDGAGFDGIVLAHNVREPAEVDSVVEQARAAGARVTVEPRETFWGGYSGAFVDPDGHAWEIAHNPFWTITDDGATLAGADTAS